MFQRFSFFKQSPHRVFDYQPRYYDERKERIKRKVAEAERALKNESSDTSSLKREISFREQMRDRWSPGYRSQARRSDFRVIIILVILLGVFYVIFNQVDALSNLLAK